MSGCLGCSCAACNMCRFEFWGFYITWIRKRAVVNHSVLVVMCELTPQLRDPAQIRISHFHEPGPGVNWSPIYEICAVSILPSIMSGIRKWKYPLLDHIASSHSQPGRSNVLGQHPVTEGFIEAQINKYHVIISSEGWGQSGAVITRVWGWLNWGCCSGKLIPHQLSAAILFHSQEE